MRSRYRWCCRPALPSSARRRRCAAARPSACPGRRPDAATPRGPGVPLGLVQADLLEIDLVLDLEVALGRAHPDGAGRGGQRLQQALEHFAVEHDRRHVGLAEARNLFKPLTEPPTFLFDHLEVDLRVRSGGHVSPS